MRKKCNELIMLLCVKIPIMGVPCVYNLAAIAPIVQKFFGAGVGICFNFDNNQ